MSTSNIIPESFDASKNKSQIEVDNSKIQRQNETQASSPHSSRQRTQDS